MLHLQQKSRFQWKRHVRLGTLAMLGLILATLLGIIMTKITWHTNFITGNHAGRVFIILPLTLFALASGWYMHLKKMKRRLLPLIHGCCNLMLTILMLMQIINGWRIYSSFVLGIG